MFLSTFFSLPLSIQVLTILFHALHILQIQTRQFLRRRPLLLRDSHKYTIYAVKGFMGAWKLVAVTSPYFIITAYFLGGFPPLVTIGLLAYYPLTDIVLVYLAMEYFLGPPGRIPLFVTIDFLAFYLLTKIALGYLVAALSLRGCPPFVTIRLLGRYLLNDITLRYLVMSYFLGDFPLILTIGLLASYLFNARSTR